MLLQGKVAWLVGASGAIGQSIGERLAGAGATVVLSSRSADKIEALAASIAKGGGKARARRTDITDNADVQAAAADIIAREGRIDCLVNSTSLSIFGDFLELTDEDWHKVLDAKLMGYLRTMRAAIPHMIRQGGGSIVNISGRGGRQPTPAHLPGGSANAAVNLVSKGLADTYWKNGVRINVIAPGPIVSARFEKIQASNERVTGGNVPNAALNRMGRPEDVAEAVVWLLSDGARHTTGAVLPVDGGGIATV